MWPLPNLSLYTWLAFMLHPICESDGTEVDQNVLFEAQTEHGGVLSVLVMTLGFIPLAVEAGE